MLCDERLGPEQSLVIADASFDRYRCQFLGHRPAGVLRPPNLFSRSPLWYLLLLLADAILPSCCCCWPCSIDSPYGLLLLPGRQQAGTGGTAWIDRVNSAPCACPGISASAQQLLPVSSASTSQPVASNLTDLTSDHCAHHRIHSALSLQLQRSTHWVLPPVLYPFPFFLQCSRSQRLLLLH